MSKPLKRISHTDKVKALKKHLLEKVPVSEVCDEFAIAPSAYYTWQQKLFEQAEQIFQGNQVVAAKICEQKRIEKLEERLKLRDEALSELMIEHIHLKKSISGLA